MKVFLNILEIVGKILLFAVLVILLMIIVVYFFYQRGNTGLEQVLEMPFMMIAQTIIVIMSVLIMYFLFERKRGWSLGWQANNRLQGFVEGSIWGILIMSVSVFTLWLFGGVKITGLTFDRDVMQGILYGILLFAMVSISEELLARGYLHGLINRHFGAAAAVISTSVLFAALHLMNDHVLQSAVPVLNLFLAGILLGVSRVVTRGLWVPIGIHFTWNLFQGNIFGFAVSGMPVEGSIFRVEVVGHHLISGGGFGVEGSLITSILLAVFTVAIWRRYSSSYSMPDFEEMAK